MSSVSFIIPVHNDEVYIEKCLESVSKLKDPSFEIIVIDDGSTDNTSTICDDFASRDDRIKVLHQENSGVSVARNTGIDQSNGKWLFFIDGDDYICPESVEEKILPKLSDAYDIIYFCYNEDLQGELIRHNNAKLGDLSITHNKDLTNIQCAVWNRYYSGTKDLLNRGFNVSAPWAKVYRSDFIKGNNLRFVPGIIRAQDQLFNANAFLYVKSLLFVFNTGYVYRGRSGKAYPYNPNLLGNMEKLLQSQKQVLDKCEDNNVIDNYKIWLCAHMIQLMRLEFCNPNNPKSFSVRAKDFSNTMALPPIFDAFKSVDLKNAGKSRHIMLWLVKHKWFFVLNLYYRNYKGAAFFAKIRKRMDS